MPYSSVVSRDSVGIMSVIVALNDLGRKVCDIGNTYLNSETRERLWFTVGSESLNQNGFQVLIEIKCSRVEENVRGLYPAHP